MVFRRSTILLVLLPFVLAGCFRQASDSFDAVDDTNAEQQSVQENIQETLPPDFVTATPPPPTLALGGDDDEDDTTNDAQPTESDTDMDTDTDTQEPDNDNNALPTLGNPVTSTPIVPATTVPQVTATNANLPFGDDDDASPDVTPTFITPGAPTGIPGAASPTPPGDDVATPSGLVTPTDFLSGGNGNNADGLPARCFYTVQPGDNLFRIAINNSTTLEQLRSSNPQIRGDVIQPGDQLTLPIVGCEGGDASPPTQPEEEPPQAGQPTTAPGQTTHTVSAGETLSVIARRYGTTITEIVQANNLTNPDRLSIGQQLIIPVGGD